MFPINVFGGVLSLGHPVGAQKGGLVKAWYKEGCYAALRMPDPEQFLKMVKEKWDMDRAQKVAEQMQ